MNVLDKLSGAQLATPSIAIFASGAGSNAKKIIEHFTSNPTSGKVSLIVCNKIGAGIFEIAKTFGIETLLIERDAFLNSDIYINILKAKNIDFIVLAGFLWKVPAALVQAYPNKIVNIHPALLPKYGGKGMYGNYVHEAVIAGGDNESGITIHYVDEVYDHGNIILQATCGIDKNDTAASLANKIHVLEHEYYAKVIEDLLLKAASLPSRESSF